MKKSILLFLLCSSFFIISCNQKEEVKIKNEPKIENKYQLEILEMDESNFYYVILDKTSGKVFIGLNSSNWYEATHETPLPISNATTYTIKVIKVKTPNGIVPQIILFDQVTSETYIYVVNNVANFYSVISPFDNIQ